MYCGIPRRTFNVRGSVAAAMHFPIVVDLVNYGRRKVFHIEKSLHGFLSPAVPRIVKVECGSKVHPAFGGDHRVAPHNGARRASFPADHAANPQFISVKTSSLEGL